MKKFLFAYTVLLTLAFLNVSAQESRKGLIDKAGKVVLIPQYDDIGYIGCIDAGLVYVEKAGKCGLVNLAGKTIVPIQYDPTDHDWSYSSGMATVEENGKWGIIDNTGRTIVSPRYVYIGLTAPTRKGSFIVEIDGKLGIVDTTGKTIVAPKYDWISPYADEGLICVYNEGKYGFIDTNGKEVIRLIYDDVWSYDSPIINGVISVKKNGKWGLIDKNGKEIIPFVYDYDFLCGSDIKGLFYAEKDGKRGYVNEAGREIVPLIYDKCFAYTNGIISVDLDHKSGWVDRTGKEIVPLQRYYYVCCLNEGLAVVRAGPGIGKCGFIDTTGKEVIPPRYYTAGAFHEGLAHVTVYSASFGYKQGFINKQGEEIFPFQYDFVDRFSEGLAKVSIGGKWGFVDKSGKLVIPLKYDDVGGFSEGLAKVSIGGKWGFVDKTGKEIIPLLYDYARDFGNGYAIIEVNNKDCLLFEEYNKKVQETIRECNLQIKDCPYNIRKQYFDSVSLVPFFLNPRLRWITDSIVSDLKRKTSELKNYCLLFENSDRKIQNTWNECNQQLMNYPYNTRKLQLEPVSIADYFLNPRLESITDSIVSEIKRKTSDLMDYCVLFENCDNKIQSTWKECNKQLMEYPYNVEKLQLEPVSITNFFLDPRLNAITDSIVSDLKQKSSELRLECYNNLKTKKPKVFSEIYLEQHPEAKSVLENLKLECRCNNYSEAELVIKIADNTVPQCTCRNDYWNQYGNFFSSRAEFDNMYNTSEQGFLDDVKLRQSLKADIQEIASMLSGLKAPKFKDGLTGKNEDIIKLLQKVQYHKGKYYYDEVVEMMFAADASMTKEWEKKGSLFSSRNEFYEAYVSGEYKNVLKEKKSK